MYNLFLFCTIAAFFYSTGRGNAMEEGKYTDYYQNQIDSTFGNIKRIQHQSRNDEKLLDKKAGKNSCKPVLFHPYLSELTAHPKFKHPVELHTKKSQTKQYLGKISGILYKDTVENVPSQEIRGFFVEILQQKAEDEIIVSKDPQTNVYLPYVVIIKKNLVRDPSIRNSNGTLLENLDISLDKLIEFDGFASCLWKMVNPITYQEESYFVIKSRPIQSELTEKDI